MLVALKLNLVISSLDSSRTLSQRLAHSMLVSHACSLLTFEIGRCPRVKQTGTECRSTLNHLPSRSRVAIGWDLRRPAMPSTHAGASPSLGSTGLNTKPVKQDSQQGVVLACGGGHEMSWGCVRAQSAGAGVFPTAEGW